MKRTLARVGLTFGCIALWSMMTSLGWQDLLAAFERVAPLSVALAFALSILNLAVGALRWRALLGAYGARRPPRVLELMRLYWVGTFFNTFMPANVGGDVLRAHATRDAFEGDAGAYLIVFVERLFGLAGLLLLASTLATFMPIAPSLPLWLAPLGVLIGVASALAASTLRELGKLLPGRLGELLCGIPPLYRARSLLAVLVLSVVIQAIVACAGHLLIRALDGSVVLSASLTFVPIALVSLYLPTVAGLGAREAAFVLLYGLVGVDEANATAASLALLGVQLITALSGGLVLLITGRVPRRKEALDGTEYRVERSS